MVQVGNTVHPVSPFDPGGLDTVDSFLSLASAQGIKWEHDMRHLTKERKEMVEQIERFKHSPAILCAHPGPCSIDGIFPGCRLLGLL